MSSNQICSPLSAGIEHTPDIEVSDPGGQNLPKSFTSPTLTGEILNGINLQIISMVRQGIVVYDKDLRYVLWNPFMEEMTGLRSNQVLGKHPSELFPFLKEQGLDFLIERALTGEPASTPEFAYYVPGTGKSGWASAVYGPLRDSNGRIVGVIATVEGITRRRLAEEALGQSEERYRNAVDRATDVIYMLSTDGTIISLNQAFETLTGWSRAEWIGRKLLGLVNPDDLALAVKLLQRVFHGESSETFELRLLSKSGEYLVGECTAAPQIENGRVVAASGMVRDITARRRAVEALRQAEKEYRSIFEHALDGMFRSTPDGQFLLANPALAEMLGYDSPEDLIESVAAIGRQFYVDPRGRDQYERLMEEHGVVKWFETQALRKDGSIICIAESGRAVRSSSGELLYYEGTIRDITEHKRVEAHLERLATAVEQAAESIVITDTDGAIQYVNPAFERASGYSRDEVRGQHPRFLKMGVPDEEFYQGVWKTITSGQVWTGRFTNKRKDGSFFEEEATISPVRERSGKIVNFVAVKRDVTKEIELEKQLLHAQKMEAVGRLAGGVAHDFNNLLTAIIGYGQLVQGRLGADHPLRPEVKEILDAGHRAAELTSQLLAFSRRQTLIPRNINLNDTIANLMKMLQRIIGEDVDVRFRASPELYLVFADAGQIDQVMMNLAVNARDAMPGGGRLVIETRNVTVDEAYCREHLWARPGNYAQISVSDTGLGMDAETQRRIFEPFFTTKEIGKGTGLGLAVVYGIINQHGGFIHLYSEPGHGTTIKVYLKAEAATAQDEAPMLQTPVRGGSETILVAEDEGTLREVARTVLGSLGYRVLLANDGEEALVAYAAAMNEIDLVILDLIMPRMGGREAYERICALGGSECPVIFMTGYAPEILKDDLGELGSAELIQKPYEVEELRRKVREVLDRQHRL